MKGRMRDPADCSLSSPLSRCALGHVGGLALRPVFESRPPETLKLPALQSEPSARSNQTIDDV
jgi:hypothetical protein